GSNMNLLKMLGLLGGAGLGIAGSQNQQNQLDNLYKTMRADRQPYLEASQGWLKDPNSYFSGPGQAAMEGVLRGLSVNGNPAGNATSQGIATEAGLRDWRSAVTGMGTLGLGGQDTQARLGTGAAQAGAGSYDAVGGALAGLTNPPRTLEDTLRALKAAGFTG